MDSIRLNKKTLDLLSHLLYQEPKKGKWTDSLCSQKYDVACEHESLLDADGNKKPGKKGKNPLSSPGAYEEMSPTMFDSRIFQSSKDDFYWLIIKLRKDYFKNKLIGADRK